MSAGTIFTELDLDFSKFEKNQQKLLQSATAASTSVEKNWQNLGVKSDNIFNAMRASAEKSFNMIKTHAGTSAGEIVRAQEAMNTKLKALNEQQYGSQLSFIDKMKGNWLAYTAAVGAITVGISKGMQYVELGAKALQAEESFRRVSESANINADATIEAMKRMTVNTIDDSTLMQKSVKAITQGLDNSTDLIKIASMARITARTQGIGVEEAFDAITNAIANKMPKALKQMGLLTTDEMQKVKEAIKNGREDVDLLAIAFGHAQVKLAQFGGELDPNAVEALQKYKAMVAENTESVGKFLLSLTIQPLEEFAAKMDTIIMRSKIVQPAGGADTPYGRKQSLKVIYDTPGYDITGWKASEEEIKALEKMQADKLKGLTSGTTNAQTDVIESWKKKMIGLKGEIAKFTTDDLGKALIEIDTKYSDSMAEVDKAARKHGVTLDTGILKTWKAIAGEQAILANDLTKTKIILDAMNSASEYQLKLDREAEDSVVKRALIEAEAAADTKRAYIDIGLSRGGSIEGGLRAKYELDKASLEIEKEKVRLAAERARTPEEGLQASQAAFDLAVKRTKLEADLGVELEKNRYLIKQQAGSFGEGFVSQLELYVKTMQTSGQRGAEAFTESYGAIKDSFSELFHDINRGELKSFEEYFLSFVQKIADAWSNMCIKMLMDYVTAQMAMKAAAATSESSDAAVKMGVKMGLSFLGSALGGSEMPTDGGANFVASYHTGGIVGAGEGRSTLASAAMFANAPRFHEGNEYPAILQRGEGVFTKGQMAALSPRGKGSESGDVTVVNITANDAKSFRDMLNRDPNAITQIVSKSLKSNQGLVKDIRRTAR